MAGFYDDEQESIQAAIREPGPFWFNDLGPLLVKPRWSKLKAEYGIEKSNYGTVRVLEGDPLAERKITGYLQRPIIDDRPQIIIESLRSDITQRYRDSGLNFYPPEVLGSNFLESLGKAIQLISNVGGAAMAVSCVLSVIHILKPEFSEYDVSYSEPSVPFSIFVGVFQDDQLNRDFRLAESILHECMHLQLTLIEDQISFVATEERLHLSPWRRALRPTRGVLHALYVFRVIQDFFHGILASVSLNESERNHVVQRLNEINADVEQMGDLSASPDLTPAGKELVMRLQIGNRVERYL